ncbi:MAG: hypothetical protein AVDCRST_MAG01-01-5088 [uncultured Rubrobacteraceae bacterium]|uniref:VOC domain-containing protein n=1 Tax=uncultured Rubrobacteraceae bacterium TaxID=349277 RepID=A0A6J4R0A6_9ACTN|nr:MAG: hypothetical protein AVDCRST_MAG01-01-5088 [uncultured Rubrobacteraceae bacterium]
MEIQGIAWLGTRTTEFEATSRFFGKTLGLPAEHEEPDFAVFRLPNGDKVEVFRPSDLAHEHFTTGPVAGFLVEDVKEARAELENAGISFIGPVHRYDKNSAWSHFVGPDGNVYEITRDDSRT